MFRDDDDFSVQRNLAVAHGIDPSFALLAGFIEGEDRSETGAIVALGGRILHYERPDYLLDEFTDIRIVENPDLLVDYFPAIRVAVEMSQRDS